MESSSAKIVEYVWSVPCRVAYQRARSKPQLEGIHAEFLGQFVESRLDSHRRRQRPGAR